MKERIRVGCILIITFGILIFLFHKVSLFRVVRMISQVDFRLILLALGVSLVGNFLFPAYRWKEILRQLDCPISLGESVLIKMGSNPIISILPLKVGEFSRLLYLKRVKGFSYTKVTFSIVNEYLLNIFVLMVCCFTGIVAFLTGGYNANLSMVRVIFVSCPLPFFLAGVNHREIKDKYRSYFVPFKVYFKEFKKIIKNKNIIISTFLIMFAEFINIFLLSKILGLSLPLYSMLIFIPLIIIAGSIPVTVMGLGMREGAVLFLFSKFASQESLLSLGILYSFVEHIFPSIIGLVLSGVFVKKVFFPELKK